MNLKPNETDLVGKWLSEGKKVRGDDVAERIEHLTSNVLEKLAVSKQYGAWETLYRDPSDGRLWERTYPQGELQGGGPPRLTVISAADAKQKYGVP